MESKLLSAFCTERSAWDSVKDQLDPELFSDAGNIILKEIDKFYGIDPKATSIDKDVLAERLIHSFPKKADFFTTALRNLQEVSVPNILVEYKDHRIRSLSQDLGTELLSHGLSARANDLVQLLTNDVVVEEEEEEVYIGGGIQDILETYHPDNLIHLSPKCLNNAVGGGVPPGTHIVLFARPEQGKSLFAINIAASFLMQGQHVLYIGNEDPHQAMRLRFISRMSGMTKDQVLHQPDEAYKRAEENGYDNLVFVGKANVGVHTVRRLTKKYRPTVVIVDQMRNLSTGDKSFSKVEAYEYIAQSLRKIYKESECLGISITQAGDSAEGKKILTMGDVDFSNTGIPATADLMLGLGSDDTMQGIGQRAISLCKNKISGDHSTLLCRVVPELSEVRDL